MCNFSRLPYIFVVNENIKLFFLFQFPVTFPSILTRFKMWHQSLRWGTVKFCTPLYPCSRWMIRSRIPASDKFRSILPPSRSVFRIRIHYKADPDQGRSKAPFGSGSGGKKLNKTNFQKDPIHFFSNVLASFDHFKNNNNIFYNL